MLKKHPYKGLNTSHQVSYCNPNHYRGATDPKMHVWHSKPVKVGGRVVRKPITSSHQGVRGANVHVQLSALDILKNSNILLIKIQCVAYGVISIYCVHLGKEAWIVHMRKLGKLNSNIFIVGNDCLKFVYSLQCYNIDK